jgi:hypothetical protein
VTDQFDRKRRLGERPDSQPQQHQRVVVAGGAIQVELVTTGASMDEDPLSVSANRDRDRFHERAAMRGPIARTLIVQVAAPQAVRAMVAVSGSQGVIRDVQPAVAAPERTLPFAPLTAALIS